MLDLQAQTTVGNRFTGWSGDLGGSVNPLPVTLNAPLTLVANTAIIANAPSLTAATSITKSGTASARVWAFTLTNGGTGPASNVRLTGVTLTATTTPSCTPTISGSFPVAMGTIAPTASANGSISIDFTGCSTVARFKAVFTYSYDGAPAIAPTKSYSNQYQYQ